MFLSFRLDVDLDLGDALHQLCNQHKHTITAKQIRECVTEKFSWTLDIKVCSRRLVQSFL